MWCVTYSSMPCHCSQNHVLALARDGARVGAGALRRRALQGASDFPNSARRVAKPDQLAQPSPSVGQVASVARRCTGARPSRLTSVWEWPESYHLGDSMLQAKLDLTADR